MRQLSILFAIIVSCSFLVGCEKGANHSSEKGVDPSKIEFEVAIEYYGKPEYHSNYEYVCYGSLGGFLGEAVIIVKAMDANGYGEYRVNVTGAKTPYSFTFFAGSHQGFYYNVLPSSFNVKVMVKDDIVMETVVIPQK